MNYFTEEATATADCYYTDKILEIMEVLVKDADYCATLIEEDLLKQGNARIDGLYDDLVRYN